MYDCHLPETLLSDIQDAHDLERELGEYGA